MTNRSRNAYGRASVLACALLTVATVGRAQTSSSAATAKELAAALDAGKLGAIAAQMPGEDDRFVAALYFPGTLLVVSARYSAPQLLQQRLEMKQYRDVYVELNGAALPDSKVFIQDVGADGLVSDDDSADSFESAGSNTTFNREWRDQNLASEEAYEQKYQDADAAYAEILGVLLQQTKR